jgi:hypothetical protein
MSSEILDKNLTRLIRHATLPAGGAARARAREEFLRAVEGSAPRRSRGIAVAAAAVLLCALVYSATRTHVRSVAPPSPPSVGKAPQDPAGPFQPLPGRGGDNVLKGELTASRAGGPERRFRFRGRCDLPDNVIFQLRIRRAEQRYVRGQLEEEPADAYACTVELTGGSFGAEWLQPGPARLTIDVSAPDSFQEMTVIDALKKLPEASRVWKFEYRAWDDSLLAKLDPQLDELAALARDTSTLIARVEEACANQDRFKREEKQLAIEARTLERRASAFARASLVPAGAREIALTASDLAISIPIFTWKDGKFDGPSSYYTNGKRGLTHRGEEFAFDALRRALDQALVVGGREVDLWILEDRARAGLRPMLIEAVDRSARRPGVPEFAERLKSTEEPDERLFRRIRTIIG